FSSGPIRFAPSGSRGASESPRLSPRVPRQAPPRLAPRPRPRGRPVAGVPAPLLRGLPPPARSEARSRTSGPPAGAVRLLAPGLRDDHRLPLALEPAEEDLRARERLPGRRDRGSLRGGARLPPRRPRLERGRRGEGAPRDGEAGQGIRG